VVGERHAAAVKLEWVGPTVVADGLAELRVAWSQVPIVFADTRRWRGSGPAGGWPWRTAHRR
jgi:hypothetical protein